MSTDIAAFIRDNVLEGATISATSEAPNYPPENVVDRLHFRVWRTEAGTATISFDLGASKTIGAWVLRAPSERDPTQTPSPLIAGADTVTIRASDTEGQSDLLNESFAAGAHPRLGYIARVLRNGGGDLAPVTARYWEVEIAAAGDHFEIENVFAGPLWTPAFNYNRTASAGIEESAEVERSVFTGAAFTEARGRLLEFVGTWSVWEHRYPGQLDAWEEFFLDAGIIKPFVLFRQLTGDLSKRTSISLFDSRPLIDDQGGPYYQVRAAFKENR